VKLLAYLRSVATKFFHRSQIRDEMEEELRSHIQHRADDLERSGLQRAEAERRARIEFGGRERFKEESQEAMGGNGVESFVQDLRFTLRVLRKSPGFTVAAVVTLALGIGANAVVFGVLNALILRPLNVPQSESLWGTTYGNGADNTGFQSYPNYLDLRDRNRSFDGLAAWSMAFVAFDTGQDPALLWGYATTGNYFDELRIQPYLGRFFHSSDEHGLNSAPYVVLSFAYWHSHFADDRNVVGRTVLLNKHPFTVIGVAPAEFHGTLLFASPAFFMPLVNQDQVNGENILNTRGNTHAIFETFGHLKPGVTPAQAVDDLKTVGAYLTKTYPKEFGQKNFSLSRSGLTSFGGAVKAFMTGLMLLAGLILLAACANLGSLFAAHAAERSREVALRLALGSSHARILRQLLTEAWLISLVGGALGLWGSVTLLRQLSMWQPFPETPVHVPVSPDASVYIVALALALVSGFLFGMVPVRQVLRTDPYQIIKAGATGLANKLGRRITVRDVLLGVQIAICAVLVTSSMVALRGLVRSMNSNFGFEPRNTMLVSANLATAGYSGDRAPAMQKRMMDAMKTIPGVERVGLVNNYPPLVNAAGNRTNVFSDEVTDLRQSNVAGMPYGYGISPGYFQAASTTLLIGRDFTWHDERNAPAVAVINRKFAVKMFGSVTNAVGKHFKIQDGTRVQVVGVVEDGKYLSLTEDQQAAMFQPFLQTPASQVCLLVRSTRDPQELAAAIRTKLRELDAGLAVETDTWNSLLEIVLFPSRVATVSLGVLGFMGAMLSVTGIFGMAAYSVSRRLKELGIRLALGAQRKEVLQAALGRAFQLLAFGSVAGLLLGILASRVLASIVYQATPRDPLVMAGVVLVMLLLGLLATWIPAQRALSVDPLTLLREE
jgi:predicted permease